jgi:hypothetical protein
MAQKRVESSCAMTQLNNTLIQAIWFIFLLNYPLSLLIY